MQEYTLNVKTVAGLPASVIEESATFVIQVPGSVGKDEAIGAIKDAHKQITEAGNHIYELNGYSPKTLVEFACSKPGWEYKEIESDGTIIVQYQLE